MVTTHISVFVCLQLVCAFVNLFLVDLFNCDNQCKQLPGRHITKVTYDVFSVMLSCTNSQS